MRRCKALCAAETCDGKQKRLLYACDQSAVARSGRDLVQELMMMTRRRTETTEEPWKGKLGKWDQGQWPRIPERYQTGCIGSAMG